MWASRFIRYWASFFSVSFLFTLLPQDAHSQQLSVSPVALGFGNVSVGTSQAQAVNITNVGSASLSLFKLTVSGAGFAVNGLSCPFTLTPGQTVSLKISFTPTTLGIETGSVSVSGSTQTWKRHWKYASSATTTASVSLSGTGISATGQLSAVPASLGFGSLPLGTSQVLSETLTNSGTTSVAISQAAFSSTQFTASGLSLPTTLDPGHSLTFNVSFIPNVSGTTSGTLTILSNASNPQLNIALSGSASAPGQVTLTPSALNFGSVSTGSKATLTSSLGASGSSVTISSGTSTSSEFVLSGVSFPATLAAGQSVPFTVTFSPQASGNAAASISFVSNATNSPTMESLTGSGLASAFHTVSLSWAASTSSGVAGYNVYRAGLSGGPYTRLASMDAAPNYTDDTVSSGQTYFYVVTAVDGSGAESTYSNQAQVVVPTP